MNRHRLAGSAALLSLVTALSVTTACGPTKVVADERVPTEPPGAAAERTAKQLGSPSEVIEAGDDWHSPGADLPPGPRLVIQAPDHTLQYVSLDGSRAILAEDSPPSLIPAGFGGIPMTDGPMVYVRQQGGGFYALDTKTGDLYPLEFVAPSGSPVAVRPVSEEPDLTDPSSGLAWGEFAAADTAVAHLYVAAQDGSQQTEVLAETFLATEQWSQFVAWQWSRDGQLFLTRQLVDGLGGFSPFPSASNLWGLDPRSGRLEALVSDELTRGGLCLDAIEPDERLVVHHCVEGQVAVLELETGATTAVSVPSEIGGDTVLGSVQLSPDRLRIAFAAMRGGVGLPEDTQGYVVVSDGPGGSSRVIATSDPGGWFSVAAWPSSSTLILQSHDAGPEGWPAVWAADADGSNLRKLADGTFLASFAG